MAKINRSDVIQKAVNDLAISTANDKVPTETLDKIQLTYSLNKHFSNFIIAGGQSTTGNITTAFPLVSAGGEVYITALQLNTIKDAACDMVSGYVSLAVTPADSQVSTFILKNSVLVSTAQSESCTLCLPYPLKIKNGTNAVVSGSFTAGLCRRDFSIVGFTTSSN